MKDINATVIINIEGKSEDEVWRNVKYTRRKYIKQALKYGMSYEKNVSAEAKKKMYKIYSEVMEDAGAAVKPYYEWEEVIRPAGDNLFLMKKGNETVGCFAFKEITERFFGIDSDKKGLRAVLFASSRKYNSYRPNDYMYWTTIKCAIEGSYDFVDLAGWQIKARGHLKNVNQFKEQWGGDVFYYYLDYPLMTAIRRKLIRNIGAFWWLNLQAKKLLRNSQRKKYAAARN